VGDVGSVRADFDRIATLPAWGFDHNAHYHSFLLDQLPARLGDALDLGCGTGEFSRLLAARSERLLGIDLSPTMIRIAKERSASFGNLSFETADAQNWDWPRARFDGIVSIAALHHLPLKEIAERMKQALRPGGVLAILDMYREHSLADYLTVTAAIPANLCFRLLSTGILESSTRISGGVVRAPKDGPFSHSLRAARGLPIDPSRSKSAPPSLVAVLARMAGTEDLIAFSTGRCRASGSKVIVGRGRSGIGNHGGSNVDRCRHTPGFGGYEARLGTYKRADSFDRPSHRGKACLVFNVEGDRPEH